jgi:branched-chain amino acid transport system substrate-binding protein
MNVNRSNILLVFSVLTFFWWCGTVSAAEPIKLGGSLGLTGRYAPMSEMVSLGLQLWAKKTNEKGGILGRPVELIIYDDTSEPAVSKKLYEKLILEDKVDMVFGPYSSILTIEAVKVTEKYKYPMLTVGSTSDKLWQQGYTHLFGVYIPASRYPFGFLKLLLRNNIGRVAIVSADDIFSLTVAEGANKWAKRLGLTVTVYEHFKKGTKKLDDLAKRIRDSGTEAIVVGGHFNESVDVRRALANIDWYPRAYFATLGPALQKYYDVLQDKAELSFTMSNWDENGVQFPGSKDFAADFKRAYGKKPSYQAAAGYASGQILETAINNINTLDRQKLRDALATLETITVLGRYGVDSTGQQIRHFALVTQWQNGRLKVVGPSDVKSVNSVPPVFK